MRFLTDVVTDLFSSLQDANSAKEEVRQAPNWMNLREGELYVDQVGVMYVSDLEKFQDEQGLSPLDIAAKAQQEAHTIIVGDDQAPGPPPPLDAGASPAAAGAATVVDPEVPSQSPSPAASSHPRDTADISSANDDLIVTSQGSGGPDTRTASQTDSTKTIAECDKHADDLVAQEDKGTKPLTPQANVRVPPGTDTAPNNDVDSAYESNTEEEEYTVNAEDLNKFTKRDPDDSSREDLQDRRAGKKTPEETSKGEIPKKDEL